MLTNICPSRSVCIRNWKFSLSLSFQDDKTVHVTLIEVFACSFSDWLMGLVVSAFVCLLAWFVVVVTVV